MLLLRALAYLSGPRLQLVPSYTCFKGRIIGVGWLMLTCPARELIWRDYARVSKEALLDG